MRLTHANDDTEYFTKPVLAEFAISHKKCVKLWREESFLPLSDWLAKHEFKPFNSHECPKWNFSLQYYYNIKQTTEESKEKHQLGDW